MSVWIRHSLGSAAAAINPAFLSFASKILKKTGLNFFYRSRKRTEDSATAAYCFMSFLFFFDTNLEQ